MMIKECADEVVCRYVLFIYCKLKYNKISLNKVRGKMDFVAIDFETANSKRNSVCSVAVVGVKDNKMYEMFYSLVKPPEMNFSYYNTQIHGITADDVRSMPTFPQIWDKLKMCLDKKIVLAHNASFDMGVLKSVLNTYELDEPNFNYYCTVSIAKKVWPDLENHKLNTLADHFNINFKHHNALHDSKVCAMIAVLATRESNSNSFLELISKVNLNGKKF